MLLTVWATCILTIDFGHLLIVPDLLLLLVVVPAVVNFLQALMNHVNLQLTIDI